MRNVWHACQYTVTSCQQLAIVPSCCCFALAWISRVAHPHEGSTCGSTTLSSFLYVSFSFAEFICNFYYGVGCFFQFFHIFLEYFLVFDGLPASFSCCWAHLEDVFLGLCFFFAESAYEVIFTPFFEVVFYWQHWCSCPYYGWAFFPVQFFHI